MIEALNLLTRLGTWGLATYRWAKNREVPMLLLSVGLWVDFLGALSQKRVLEELGWVPNTEALPAVMSLMAVVEGEVFLIASLFLLGRLLEARGQATFLVTAIIGLTYVVVATLMGLGTSFVVAYPLVFLGASLILLGYTLFRETPWRETMADLFPAGAILLGAINVTFPVTSKIPTVSSYLYGVGAVARLMMLLGITAYSFLTIQPPKMPAGEIPKGAFYTTKKETLLRLISTMQETGNGILVTRTPPEGFKSSFPVFWLTKALSGRVSENVMAVSPTDIGILIDVLKKCLDSGHSIVVLEGLEYLVLENGFESALKFLLSLKDFVMSHGGTMVVFLDPNAFSPEQLKIIQREFEEFSS